MTTKFEAGKVTLATIATVTALGLGIFAYSYNNVAADEGSNDDKKVTICHKNEGNGWTRNSVNDDSVDGDGNDNNDHNRDGHHSGEDIIPPFYENGQPGGWNSRHWDTNGQAIWNNNCGNETSTATATATPVVTASPTPTDVPTSTPIETATPTETPRETETPTATPVETQTPNPETTPDPSDVCWNIDGVQTSLPSKDWYFVGEGSHICREFQYGGPSNNNGGNGGGQVLGASTSSAKGSVLGASTMGATGGFAQTLYQAIMSLGGILTITGAKKLKVNKKK